MGHRVVDLLGHRPLGGTRRPGNQHSGNVSLRRPDSWRNSSIVEVGKRRDRRGSRSPLFPTSPVDSLRSWAGASDSSSSSGLRRRAWPSRRRTGHRPPPTRIRSTRRGCRPAWAGLPVESKARARCDRSPVLRRHRRPPIRRVDHRRAAVVIEQLVERRARRSSMLARRMVMRLIETTGFALGCPRRSKASGSVCSVVELRGAGLALVISSVKLGARIPAAQSPSTGAPLAGIAGRRDRRRIARPMPRALIRRLGTDVCQMLHALRSGSSRRRKRSGLQRRARPICS